MSHENVAGSGKRYQMSPPSSFEIFATLGRGASRRSFKKKIKPLFLKFCSLTEKKVIEEMEFKKNEFGDTSFNRLFLPFPPSKLFV